MDIEYAIRRIDTLAFDASSILNDKAPVHRLTCDDRMEDILAESSGKLLAVLFWCDGKYPSNHCRLLKAEDLKYREFELPDWLPKWGEIPETKLRYIALQPPSNKRVQIRDNFPTAILDLHNTLTQPVRAKKIKVIKTDWKAEKRRDHFA